MSFHFSGEVLLTQLPSLWFLYVSWLLASLPHTYLTHSYLLKDEDPPICIPGNSLLTVEHILISCIDFDIIRQNFYTASNLKDLLHNIHPKRIICFVHTIGLPNKL